MATVTLNIFVQDISTVLQSYNAVKIRRSRSGESGPWEELTASSPTKALLLAPTAGPYNLNGKTLSLEVDQSDAVSIVFTANDMSADEAAGVVNAVVPGIASEVDGALQIRSTSLGTISKLKIAGGGAASVFGWVTGDVSYGKDQYITLQAGVDNYTFIDKNGAADYYYGAAFYNTVTNLQSVWSDPFKGAVGTVVSSAHLSTAKVDLVDAGGAAVSGQVITFYSQFDPLKVEGYQVAIVRKPVKIETDNSGHAEASLVRGLRLKVVFEGTALIRDITVPDEDSFDLLDLMAVAPDPFSPVDPEVPYAIRRTL
jgi:hypothetical protein